MGWLFDSAEELNQKGVQCYERGDYERALRHFLKATKRGPDPSVHWQNLANTLMELRAYSAAYSAFREAEDRGSSTARQHIDATNWCALLPAKRDWAKDSGLGALLGLALGGEFGKNVGQILETIVINVDFSSKAPYGSISDLSVRHGARRQGVSGLRMRCKATLGNAMWRTCGIRLDMYYANGRQIQSQVNEYATVSGGLVSTKDLRPQNRVANYSRVRLFVPYSAFPDMDTGQGARGRVGLYGPLDKLLAEAHFDMTFR